jgi:iron-sulfur cluster repair protein YtfE (RIC family)
MLLAMIPITRALTAEHKMFCAVFDQIECLLPSVGQLAQVRELSRLVEGLLQNHAAAEEDLVLLALDHTSQHKRRCDRIHQEHQEIDSRITRVHGTKNLARARSLLRAAMTASRKHFAHEERVVFPLVERVMNAEALMRLGGVWMRRRHMPANWSF